MTNDKIKQRLDEAVTDWGVLPADLTPDQTLDILTKHWAVILACIEAMRDEFVEKELGVGEMPWLTIIKTIELPAGTYKINGEETEVAHTFAIEPTRAIKQRFIEKLGE